MIRGPILPQSREGLWPLLADHLEAIETGLTLVAEGFDCSNGQFGAVDGLARDAAGAPVLLIVAVHDDPLLAARATDAAEFLERVGSSLAVAVPEAQFRPDVLGRVVLIAANGVSSSVDQLVRRAIRGVHVCRLEAFRLAGSERFAVLWQTQSGTAETCAPAVPEFACSAEHANTWRPLHDFCLRIDPAVVVAGDRYRRTIRWKGHSLGEVVVRGDCLHGTLADGVDCPLATASDVRTFSDRLLRCFLRVAGLTIPSAPRANGRRSDGDNAAVSRHTVDRHGIHKPLVESLRSAAAAARLSPEEYSALGSPASEAGGETEAAATADDVARIVSAQATWPEGRTD